MVVSHKHLPDLVRYEKSITNIISANNLRAESLKPSGSTGTSLDFPEILLSILLAVLM
jgi:hypothetical protein